MSQNKILGVLGGLGPMASVYFYELVTTLTDAKTDQEHIDMLISSRATTPDRTAFIIGKSKLDPFAVMLDEAKRLANWGAQVIAIPCNTAHYFYSRLNEAVDIPILNMVGGTVEYAKSNGISKVGILATDGTVQSGTYQIVCEQHGLPFAIPSPEAQKNLMSVIYDGVKAGNPPDMELFHSVADSLFEQGCDALILGCTELSLLKRGGGLDSRFIDSMEVLADLAILACGKKIRSI